VEAQRRDPDSLLNWMERKIRMRRECPEIGWGAWEIVETTEPDVLVMRYSHDGYSLFTFHNFSDKPRAPRLEASVVNHTQLVDLLARNDSRADAEGRHTIQLPAYGYRWYRPGGVDPTVVAPPR
jgi:maltose alpha-D-glucosyltransferase/alpha-amylase